MKRYYLWIAASFVFMYVVYYFFFKQELVLGQEAPGFSQKNTQGQEISLQKFKGKYLLIDFWGSWCNPCRRENPVLVMMYNKYKDKKFKVGSGIEFLSVALDQNEEEAKSAILHDGLKWPDQIIDPLQLDGALAKLYQVRYIPMKYLIGPDQLIILRNPTIKELDDFLAYQILKN
jgi:thiol-disulfide isomerase/thioredoxin